MPRGRKATDKKTDRLASFTVFIIRRRKREINGTSIANKKRHSSSFKYCHTKYLHESTK